MRIKIQQGGYRNENSKDIVLESDYFYFVKVSIYDNKFFWKTSQGLSFHSFLYLEKLLVNMEAKGKIENCASVLKF